MTIPYNDRRADHPADQIFLDRWSPRAFADKTIPAEYLDVIFEAARWAPSCFNEQPWRFLVAVGGGRLALFKSLLTEKNRQWADRAPVIVFLLARRTFTVTGKPNRHAGFDAGAAWMSAALQARKMGLFTHAMAGIDYEGVYDKLGVDRETFEVVCGIAIGHYGDPATLSDEARAMEAPNGRASQGVTVFYGDPPAA
jgi:nitroreductase